MMKIFFFYNAMLGSTSFINLLIYKLFTIILIMFLIISVKYGHCTLMTSFPYYYLSFETDFSRFAMAKVVLID